MIYKFQLFSLPFVNDEAIFHFVQIFLDFFGLVKSFFVIYKLHFPGQRALLLFQVLQFLFSLCYQFFVNLLFDLWHIVFLSFYLSFFYDIDLFYQIKNTFVWNWSLFFTWFFIILVNFFNFLFFMTRAFLTTRASLRRTL